MATTDSAAAHSLAMPKITNSAAGAGDPCAITVSARAEGAMKLMKLDEWERVCQRAQKAKAHTGISTSMMTKKSPLVNELGKH